MKAGTLELVFAAALAAVGWARWAGAQDTAPVARTGQSEITLASGTTINAELNSSIDSKKVKPGDTVLAHTTETLKSTDDRTILPRGTKLVGHVTQAAARSKGDSDSTLAISFDKAIVKGGEEVALNATIQALAAPAGFSSPSSNADLDNVPSAGAPAGSPGMAGSTSSMGNRGNTNGYPRAGAEGANPGIEGDANSSSRLAANQRGVFGMNGLRLNTTNANNTPVSVISAPGKNVHLDSGTRLLLVTQAVPAEGSGR
jgi:Bacterial conjugation TrbI-like protein